MLSSNPLSVALVVVFIAGAIIFIVGSMLARERETRAPEAAPAPQLDVEGRIDMVERLAMVGQPWCVEQLGTIRDTDPDESVRYAAESALIVIASRPS